MILFVSVALACHPFYCNPLLLDRSFNDSKDAVDVSFTVPYPQFLNNTFSLLPPGSDLEPVLPLNIVDSNHTFKVALYSSWHHLLRKAKTQPTTSLLPLPFPFIVPGGRFRETYYWDNFWIVKGLLVSGLYESAKNVVQNMLWMVNVYGYVPNGSRLYYLGRSQPPFLVAMVYDIWKATGDKLWMIESLDLLGKEMHFWNSQRLISVNGYELNIYKGIQEPRYESLKQDQELARKVGTAVYRHLRAAAESGWDFSSRWFRGDGLETITTEEFVPVDLNAILYKMETLLAEMFWQCGKQKEARLWESKSERRKEAIVSLFYDLETKLFYDYDLKNARLNKKLYASAIVPLWAGVLDKEKSKESLSGFMQEFGVYKGGIPTSKVQSGQQWDYPNAWAPIQWFASEALDANGMEKEAFEVREIWIETVRKGWEKAGTLYEKYSVENHGTAGDGGEYKVQDGFGWTNGVVLSFLAQNIQLKQFDFTFVYIICGIIGGFIVFLAILSLYKNKKAYSSL